MSGLRQQLRAALEEANIPTLLMVVAQITGDSRWLEEPFRPTRPRGISDNDSGGLAEDAQQVLRAEAYRLLAANPDASFDQAASLSAEELTQMLGVSMGERVPADYGPLLCEEMGLLTRDIPPLDPDAVAGFRVLVIGAGFAGLCAAIKLQQAGIPYVVIEKNRSVGGTWIENCYPGCGVDTPSHLYSFSFAPEHPWSRYYAPREEIHSYIEDCATSSGVRSNIRFDTEVVAARYDDATRRWAVRIRGTDGREETLVANAVISAVGLLNRPKAVDLPGLHTFSGPVMHTARWDPEVGVEGKRVCVVGTGASAMQLVPAIAGIADRVTVFQRSPQWALPNQNYRRMVSESTQFLFDHVPSYLRSYRLRLLWTFGDNLHPFLQIDPTWPHQDRSINKVNDKQRLFLSEFIASELGDRQDLLDRVLPSYPPFGKRALMDNQWFQTMTRDDVELVTGAIREVRPGSIRTTEGAEYPADVLVIATGFESLRVLWPMEIRGRSGSTIRDAWGDDDARAYLGITVPDFPNLFVLYGPNTNPGHGGSMIFYLECQVRYVMRLLHTMIEERIATVECRRDVHDAYNARVDAAHEQMIWTHPGMETYYRNSRGRVVTNTPWRTLDYWRMTYEPDLNDFSVQI